MKPMIALVLALLALSILTPVAGAAPVDMPACCWAPQNRWDERCVGARFQYPPGYNSSDPGTWTGYNPWGGGCNSIGSN